MKKLKTFYLLIAFAFVGWTLFGVANTNAANLLSRKIVISNPQAEATNVTYTVEFDINDVYSMGSIVIEFCDNDPIINNVCIPISGFNSSAASLVSESGETGFSIHPNTNINTIVLGRVPSNTTPGRVIYEIGGITNPDEGNHAFYARIYTKASNDGTGVEIDSGGVALTTTNEFNISTEVPPFLTFCNAVTIGGFNCNDINGDFIDFGELSPRTTKTGTSQFIVGTNANYGFAVYVTGNPPTAGNNVINAMNTQQTSQVGRSQFGINLRHWTAHGCI